MTDHLSGDVAADTGIEFLDDEPVAAELIGPQGHACEACGTPLDAGDPFCSGCGKSQGVERVVEAEVAEPQRIRCEQCGAEIEVHRDERSYVCPFCESTYVLELPVDAARQPPEFIIGFAVAQEQAESLFRDWIGTNGWFQPSDLREAARGGKLRGVYLPFWRFSMLAQSRWRARIGEHWYRTETYTTQENGKTVTKTRRVQETEWWPLAGRHHLYHNRYLVSGSEGLSQADADRVKPFNLPALKRYQPFYLAGWQAQEYTVDRPTALRIAQEAFGRMEAESIRRFLPGDTHRDLDVDTSFSDAQSDLCLLPVYLMNYRYRDKAYRFLINGQTGKVVGDKPVSGAKIAILVGSIIGLILFIIVVVLILMGLGS